MATIPGKLSLYHNNLALFESGALTSSSAVIFIGGLSDGLYTTGYLNQLSHKLAENGWSLVMIVLSSSYNQYGLSSLESDADEIGKAVDYLRKNHGKDKIVLLGHSTGCQDAMQYLTVNAASRPPVSGAILQAPVSDMEFFERHATADDRHWVSVAAQMVADGKGEDWMPKEACSPTGYLAPFTAYRYASLYKAGGDDDFFSSILPTALLKFKNCVKPVQLLLSNEDESYPVYLESLEKKQTLLQRWMERSDGKISEKSGIIEGANHTIDDPEARRMFYDKVIDFIQDL